MNKELIFGRARAFTRLIQTLDQYAQSQWPVLLTGETGVGKELLARRIHERSARARSLFLPINCGAIPAGLFESELFGYERGAFSGAGNGSRGLLRQAHHGTIFLDEIGELDLSLQVKLLRWLDSGEVRSVGSSRVEHVDVRLVAATNVDLGMAIADGRFRRDLWERLAVLAMRVPPLRERREDILSIAHHWLHDLAAPFEPDALDALSEFDWPGNVRQLRNLLVRASVRKETKVTRALVEELIREEEARSAGMALGAGSLLEGSLEEIEKQVIVEKLKQCHGNRKKTAESLGIAKSTLHEKLRKWKEPAAIGLPLAAVPMGG